VRLSCAALHDHDNGPTRPHHHDYDNAEHAPPVSFASAGPVAVIDGPTCGLLAKYLRVVTCGLPSERLAAIRLALDAIDAAAEAQRTLDRQALDADVINGWVSVADAASMRGCTPQNIRKRLARGTLAGDKRGRVGGWT
jgi:hypothetical protein